MSLNGKSLNEKSLPHTRRDGKVRPNSLRTGKGQGKGSNKLMVHCKQCGFVFDKKKVDHSGGGPGETGNGGYAAVSKTLKIWDKFILQNQSLSVTFASTPNVTDAAKLSGTYSVEIKKTGIIEVTGSCTITYPVGGASPLTCTYVLTGIVDGTFDDDLLKDWDYKGTITTSAGVEGTFTMVTTAQETLSDGNTGEKVAVTITGLSSILGTNDVVNIEVPFFVGTGSDTSPDTHIPLGVEYVGEHSVNKNAGCPHCGSKNGA